jgi:hypothetical protein
MMNLLRGEAQLEGELLHTHAHQEANQT